LSYTWSVLKTDKNSKILGACSWGFGSIFFIGALLNYLGFGVSIWIGLFLIFIIFPVTTYLFYKYGFYKRKNKNKTD